MKFTKTHPSFSSENALLGYFGGFYFIGFGGEKVSTSLIDLVSKLSRKLLDTEFNSASDSVCSSPSTFRGNAKTDKPKINPRNNFLQTLKIMATLSNSRIKLLTN